MADYRYSQMLSMQEQAIKRVNEMRRREKEAAQRASRDLGGGSAQSRGGKGGGNIGGYQPFSPIGKSTSLPVDYLHGTAHQSGNSGGNQPNNNAGSANRNSGGNGPMNNAGGANRNSSLADTPKHNARGGSAPDKSGKQGGNSASNGKNGQNPAPQNRQGRGGGQSSWAQNAVHRSPQKNESNKSQAGSPFNLSQVLDGIERDSDALLLLGLIYILGRDHADKSLLFALLYILM